MRSPLVLLAALAVPTTSLAQQADAPGRDVRFLPEVLPSADTGLSPGNSASAVGMGLVHASTTTRTAGVGTPVSCPLGLKVPAYPSGATGGNILIFWNYLSNDTPLTDTILVNGTPVTGQLVGAGDPDLGWGKAFGCAYAVEWMDPSLSPVVVGGSNTLDDVCDKILGSDLDALGEGVTIIATYEGACSPERFVTLSGFGYTSTESSGGPASGLLRFGAPYDAGPVRLVMNGLDGQRKSSDLLLLNGSDVSGVIDGTFTAGDAFAGQSGPDATNNLYDVVDDDVSFVVNPGDTALKMEAGFGDDTVGVTMGWTETDTGNCSVTEYCTPSEGHLENQASIGISSCDLAPGTTVDMSGGPPNNFTYLLLGDSNGIIVDPPGADADLCVAKGTLLRRYFHDVGKISASGTFSTDISNSASGGPGFGIPGGGGGTIDAGETFTFQYWHREGAANPSRFSSAICVTFYE